MKAGLKLISTGCVKQGCLSDRFGSISEAHRNYLSVRPAFAVRCPLRGACKCSLSGIYRLYWHSLSSEGQRVPVFPVFFNVAQNEKSRLFRVWLPIVDAYRTFCLAPSREVRAVFVCEHCGGKVKVLAVTSDRCIEDQPTIDRILSHLGKKESWLTSMSLFPESTGPPVDQPF